MSKQIAIHKHGAEGGLHINAATGQITTPVNERPDWADGYVSADLAEFALWRDSRFGDGAPDYLKTPEVMEVGLLAWAGIDAEGDEVEIAPLAETRTSMTAQVLGIDTSADGWEKSLEGTVAQHLVDHDYSINPSTEASLAEAEGLGFEDAGLKVQNG